jgi:CHAD domain-containing protein
MIWVLEHSPNDFSFKKLKKLLRELGKTLGSLREIDVAIADAERFKISDKKLASMRKASKKAVKCHLEKPILKDFKKRLKKAAGEVRQVDQLHPEIALLEVQLRLDPWNSKKLRTSTDYHLLRVAMKKVRYTLESIGKPVSPLKELQNQLGKIHDLEVLQELTGKNRKVSNEVSSHKRIVKRTIPHALAFARRSSRV